MAKRAEMPWDCIITTELRRTFKPEREAYLLAPTLLDLQPDQVMLVAAHESDLKRGCSRAARPLGPSTAGTRPALDFDIRPGIVITGSAATAYRSSDFLA